MSKKQLSIRNLSPIFLVVAVGVMGATLWFSPTTSAGTRVTSEPQKAHTAYGDARTPSANIGMSYAAILKPALSAVVNISSSKVVKTQGSGPFEFFNDPFFQQFFGDQFHQFRMPREQRERSLGSGVIVRPNGYILSNNHVIEGASEIKVFLPDKREFKGKVVGADKKTDLAVIKIDAQNLPMVSLGIRQRFR